MWVPVFKAIPYLVSGLVIINIFKEPKGLFTVGFLFMVAWLGVWFALTLRWKWVHLVGDKLRISNFFTRIEVPRAEIHWVEGSPFWGVQPQTAKLFLRESTVFGSEISFIPAGGMYWAEKWAENLRQELGLEK